MEKHCISVDWLQVCCLCNNLKEGIYDSNNYRFRLKLTDVQTAMFKDLYSVYIEKLQVATIQTTPRTTKLNKNLTLIKIENRVLYSQKYIEVLYALMNATNCKYKGITRLDLCYDCVKYKNGRSPSRFINQFISKECEEKGYIYRRGSDRFACYGSKTKSSKAKISSIRFGSEKSRIGAYVYDKTVELKEVKDKPWIREMWKENGLLTDESNHVFRSEISIKAQGMDMLNMGTGELFRLSPNYLEHHSEIVKIFHFYAKKYFDFRICNGQKCKKNYDHLYLFECDTKITCKPVQIPKTADTGRMEKICYNKLKSLSEQYTDLSEYRRIGLQSAMDFLSELTGIKSGTIRKENYKRYLDTLRGHYFIDWHTLAYLASIEEARKARKELDAEMTYALFQNASLEDLGLY